MKPVKPVVGNPVDPEVDSDHSSASRSTVTPSGRSTEVDSDHSGTSRRAPILSTVSKRQELCCVSGDSCGDLVASGRRLISAICGRSLLSAEKRGAKAD